MSLTPVFVCLFFLSREGNDQFKAKKKMGRGQMRVNWMLAREEERREEPKKSVKWVVLKFEPKCHEDCWCLTRDKACVRETGGGQFYLVEWE